MRILLILLLLFFGGCEKKKDEKEVKKEIRKVGLKTIGGKIKLEKKDGKVFLNGKKDFILLFISLKRASIEEALVLNDIKKRFNIEVASFLLSSYDIAKKRFLEEMNLTYPISIDLAKNRKIFSEFKGEILPFAIIFKEGKEVLRYEGGVYEEFLIMDLKVLGVKNVKSF